MLKPFKKNNAFLVSNSVMYISNQRSFIKITIKCLKFLITKGVWETVRKKKNGDVCQYKMYDIAP